MLNLSILFFLLAVFSQADAPSRFESILVPKEARLLAKKDTYPQKMKVLRQVFKRLLGTLGDEVSQGEAEKVDELIEAIHISARYGLRESGQASNQKERKSKPVRRLEIQLRLMIEDLESLKRASPAASWQHFDDIIEETGRLRDKLLEGIFFSPLPQRKQEKPSGQLSFVGAPAAVESSPRQTSISGDQMTEAEYEAIRDAQEIEDRVKVFLEIAEARLDEIERRVAHKEWDKKEPNPLEFYTFAQLVRAYERSIEGIMINIDEKATHELAPPKEIRKALKRLNGKIQEFMPRLQPVEDLAKDRQDEELYLEWRKAWKSSQKALEGSKRGLAATEERKKE